MKNIIITGSSRGLGYEMAKCFLECGCAVTISGRNPVNLTKAEQSLSKYKERLQAISCDVRKRENILNLWKQAAAKWGKIDIWINNAGISQPFKGIWELTAQETEVMIQNNLISTIYGSQIAIQEMLKQGEGQVFNMEGFGSDGMRRKGLNIYGLTKNAITYFTKALAGEAAGTPVKVGALSPGMMVTEFITGTADQPRQVNEETKRIFNILGNKPETVAQFLVPRILRNQKNGVRIAWLTRGKAMARFGKALFVKRDLFGDK